MNKRRDATCLGVLNRRGFTVCELLIVIACIATLLAMLLPAVVYARESARRTTCGFQLREVGIALQVYHDRQRSLPAAWGNEASEPTFLRGWATQLLPELGETALAESLYGSSAASSGFSETSLSLLLCPSDITEPTFVLRAEQDDEDDGPSAASLAMTDADDDSGGLSRVLPTASYVGVFGTLEADEFEPFGNDPAAASSDGAIVHDLRVRIADLERGASKTILIGERTMAMVPSTWLGVDADGEDAQCRLVGSAMTRPNCEECDECEFSSRHTGGANFLWADGHVLLIEDDVDSSVYRQYSQRFVR